MATQGQVIENLLKIRYGKIENRVPSDNYLLRKITFDPKRLGASKEIAVVLGNPQNHTWASRSDGPFTYNQASTVKIEKAKVNSTQYGLSLTVGYDDIISSSQLKNTKRKDLEKAFDSAENVILDSMLDSSSNALELNLRHGGGDQGVGRLTKIEAVSGEAKQRKLTMDKKYWAEAIFNTHINGHFDIFAEDSNKASTGSKLATVVVSKVDADNRQLTVILQGTDTLAAATVNRILEPAGTNGTAPIGLAGIAQGSGDLFGIDRDAYPMWKAIRRDIKNKKVKYSDLFAVAAKSVQRYKGMKKDMVCLVNPETFASFLEQDASKYENRNDETKRVVGATSIMIKSPAGMIELVSYKYEFASTAILFVRSALERVGVCDLTMTPGGGEFLKDLDRTAGKEARTYANQALFTSAPACIIELYNIDNEATE